jgi:dUTP pyrophosphatase
MLPSLSYFSIDTEQNIGYGESGYLQGETMKLINKSANEMFYETNDAAGFDIKSNEDGVLSPGDYKLFKTGLFLDLSAKTANEFAHIRDALLILPRSGLAFKHGVTVLNSPGLIDQGYPGEIGVLLINHGKVPFEVKVGDRIAQGVFTDVYVTFGDIKHKDIERAGGFGSTGN